MKIAQSGGYVLRGQSGVADVWFPSSPEGLGRYSIKVSARETEGRLFQMHSIDPRGAAPPLHTHTGDETLYVIRGDVEVFIGDDHELVGAGDCVVVPRGTPHTWLARSEEVEMLVTLSPAGLEGFFIEFGVPAVPGQPPPERIVLDPEEAALRADAYGLEFLGPPPTL